MQPSFPGQPRMSGFWPAGPPLCEKPCAVFTCLQVRSKACAAPACLQVILHTGDMRWQPAMAQHPALKAQQVRVPGAFKHWFDGGSVAWAWHVRHAGMAGIKMRCGLFFHALPHLHAAACTSCGTAHAITPCCGKPPMLACCMCKSPCPPASVPVDVLPHTTCANELPQT